MYPEKKPVFLLLILLVVLLALPSPVLASPIAPATTTATPALNVVPVRAVPVIPVTTTAAPSGPQIGAISISSTPSGASVIIDGSAMGTSPFTLRTLTVGSHTLVLQMGGYLDYTDTIVIQAGQLDQQSYTLTPVPATAVPTATQPPVAVQTAVPATPAATVVPVATPPPPAPANSLSAQFRFPRQVSISPLTIRVGSHTRTPILTTLSPYFAYQLSAPEGTNAFPAQMQNVASIPTTYIEVDSKNVYLPGSHVMSSVEMANDPIWGDEDSVPVKTTDKFFNNTNFRWLSLENGVTAFYQVSRYPFDSNASRWKNQYVPGLVAAGPANDIHADSEGFHYFSLNFAPIANHNPADPPFYTGFSQLDEILPGKGTTMGLTRIPFTGAGIYTKKAVLGPLSFPVPAGFAMIPAGELTEQELGSPNGNMLLSTAGISSNSLPSSIESVLMDMPQTYYVRIVPIHKDGTAGIPTLPVKVTVVRPKPCPPNPPGNTENDIVVSPPSGTVASFYMTSFVPDWIHTDQNGKLVSRAHFVTVATPPFCSASSSSAGIWGAMYSPMCAGYGGSQPGYHFYADPQEDHWYDTAWAVITGLFSAFSQVIDAVSAAWNQIQDLVVEEYALMIRIYSFDTFRCDQYSWCTDIIRTGVTIAETSLGIPPTIPDTADLEGMGADYMAKVTSEELGVDSVYNAVPDKYKQGLESQAGQTGSGIVSSLVSHSNSQIELTANSWFIPDPLYYQVHPAMVMVKVFNPNNLATDPVTMRVSDSAGLFKMAHEMYVPALRPGDSTIIPVILEEDYTRVFTATCNADSYTSTCGDICVPCYWNNWYFAVKDSSDHGGDTFSVTFYDTKENDYSGLYKGYPLTPSTSGTVLASSDIMNFDEQGNSCGAYHAKTVLKYPDNWQMQENGLAQDLWSLCWLKYSFTEGDKGRLRT